VDKNFDSSKFLGLPVYWLGTTDMQGLDGFSTNVECSMFFLTSANKLRSVWFQDGKLSDSVADYSCNADFCRVTFPEMQPIERTFIASDHLTWGLAHSCHQTEKNEQIYHVNNLWYFSTTPNLDESFVRSLVSEKMPAMISRNYRKIN
jgi:hypothetical protein